MSSLTPVPLHFKSYGDGKETLVILHGLFGCLDNWHTFAKKISTDFHVLTVDQRNHGRSPHTTEFSYLHMAEDLHNFLISHNFESISLIGHSMGGKTAMYFALKYPEKVNKLIAVDMAPKAYPPQHTTIFEALESIDFQITTTRGEVDEQLKNFIPEDSVRLFLMKNMTRNEIGELAWKINLPALRSAYASLNEGLATQQTYLGPTLFIKGGKSSYIKDDDQELIQKIFPNSQTKTIASAGHWVHAESPREFHEVVFDFLTTK